MTKLKDYQWSNITPVVPLNHQLYSIVLKQPDPGFIADLVDIKETTFGLDQILTGAPIFDRKKGLRSREADEFFNRIFQVWLNCCSAAGHINKSERYHAQYVNWHQVLSYRDCMLFCNK